MGVARPWDRRGLPRGSNIGDRYRDVLRQAVDRSPTSRADQPRGGIAFAGLVIGPVAHYVGRRCIRAQRSTLDSGMESEGFIDVDGGRVWYTRTGAGSGLPLLCVHGGPGFAHGSIRSLTDLADREVIFYDQLGCGRSDKCDDDSLLTLERFVGEIDRIRDRLYLDELHLFGTSWGSTIAAAYAMGQSDGLTGLVLSSPLISTPRWVEDALALRAELPSNVRDELDRHERGGYTRCPEYVAAMLVYYKRHVCRLDPWPAVLEDAFANSAFEVYEKMWGPSEFHPTGTLLGLDLSPGLPDINATTLFVCGEHDEATPATVEDFARSVKDARFEVVRDASHMPLLEKPETYLGLLRDFLRSVDEG